MRTWLMRIYFFLYRIELAFSLMIDYLYWAFIAKPFIRLLCMIPYFRYRLKIQGKTQESLYNETKKISHKNLYDLEGSNSMAFAYANMGAFFAGIIVDVVMLPQLFISTPYYVRTMNDMPVLCISFLFAAGFFLSHILVIHDDIYIPYFKKFMKEPKRKEWSWHLISVVSIVLTILIFMYLTDYCFHME